MVHQRLKAEFARVLGEGSEVIHGMIRKCAKLSKQMFDNIPLDDAAAEEEDDLDDNDDEDEEEEDLLEDDVGEEDAVADDLGAGIAVNLDDSGAFAMI